MREIDIGMTSAEEKRPFKFYSFLSMGYMTTILASVVLFPLLVQLGPLQISASLFSYPVTYMFGDLIAEVYGYKYSRRLIWSTVLWGNLSSIFVSNLVEHTELLLTDPNIESYVNIISSEFRYTLAGTIAMLSGSFINAYLISKTKIIFCGKSFWLRSLGATLTGEFCNTFLVFSIGMSGQYSSLVILKVIASSYLFKVLYAIPLVAIGTISVFYLKKAENLDPFDTNINYNPFHLD